VIDRVGLRRQWEVSPTMNTPNVPHTTWAQHYDEAYRMSFGRSYDALTEATVDYITQLQPPCRILDVGAGTGRVSLPLAAAGYTVVATDPCEEMLAVLKEKAQQQNLTIETVCCRMADKIPLPPFDVALCLFTVLAYLVDESALNASFQGGRRRTTTRLGVDRTNGSRPTIRYTGARI